MAYNFTEKKKHTQEENAFITYMIISSYFHKAVCRNWCLIWRLNRYYQDMSGRKQEEIERSVIKKADECLKGVEKNLSLMNCDVTVRYVDGVYRMNFVTGFERVCAQVDPNGRVEIEVKNAEGVPEKRKLCR